MEQTVTLVPFGPEHIERSYHWVREPSLRRDFLMRGEVTPEGHREYFNAVMNDPTQRAFAVVLDGIHVGNGGLKNLRDQSGELWIYIGDPSARGRGVGAAATRQLLACAFSELDLQSVSLHVADFNTVARSLYEGVGFEYEELCEDAKSVWAGRGFEVLQMRLWRSAWTSR